MKNYKLFIPEEDIDPKALHQFHEAMAQDDIVKGALMPDVHAGYSLPIGGVVASKGFVYPAFVGYDIGCGVAGIKLPIKRAVIEAHGQEIYDEMLRTIPIGFKHNEKNSKWDYSDIPRTEVMDSIFHEKGGLKQLCSMGGNNHYQEIGYDENDDVWISVHSGSRGVGHAVATHYMRIAGGGKAREGCFSLNVESQDGKDYIKDLNFCLEFALENRKQIIQRVIVAIEKVLATKFKPFNLSDESVFINRNHNHAELKDGLWIHRKGATHAEKGMRGIIPGNRKDGLFVVEGLGNPESLCSSSHGAGRIKGRKQARKDLNLDDYKKEMKGIIGEVSEATLEEASGAYKNIFDVMEMQKDLVTVKHHVKVLINVKACKKIGKYKG